MMTARYMKTKAAGGRSGQAMLEYVVAFVSVLGLVAALAFLMVAVKRNGVRVLDLVASEYP